MLEPVGKILEGLRTERPQKRLLFFLMLAALASFSTCTGGSSKKFVANNLLDTGRGFRATTVEDLRLWRTEQLLRECQSNCEQLERQREILRTSVARYEDFLLGVERPAPPYPCPQGQCAWTKDGLLSYVIDRTKNTVRSIRVEDLQGKAVAMSVLGNEAIDPDGRFAVIRLKEVARRFPTGLVNVVIERLDADNSIITESLRVNVVDK